MSITLTTLTPGDLINMGRPPGGKHYELTGSGELIIVGNAGKRHEDTKAYTIDALVKWVRRSVGIVYSETMFTIGKGARIPDVAFVSTATLKAHPQEDGAIAFAPDLAVEVISESEPAEDAEQKVREYLAAGVQEVWQMYPKSRFIRVRTSAGYRDLYPSDVISTPVLPGFTAAVFDLFPEKHAASKRYHQHMGSVTALTPADLLTMGRPPGGKHYELSGSGELITVGNAGKKHELTKSRTASALFKWERPETGVVFIETMFTIGEGARIPDVAFVSKAKMDAHPEDDGPLPFAPDLAIEVVSDSEPAEDAEEKVREYLAAAVYEVWQMYPKSRFIRVRTSAGYRDLYPSDVISTPVLPGFSAAVGDLFPA